MIAEVGFDEFDRLVGELRASSNPGDVLTRTDSDGQKRVVIHEDVRRYLAVHGNDALGFADEINRFVIRLRINSNEILKQLSKFTLIGKHDVVAISVKFDFESTDVVFIGVALCKQMAAKEPKILIVGAHVDQSVSIQTWLEYLLLAVGKWQAHCKFPSHHPDLSLILAEVDRGVRAMNFSRTMLARPRLLKKIPTPVVIDWAKRTQISDRVLH